MEPKEFIHLSDQLKSGDNTRLKFIFEANSAYCINRLLAEHSCSFEDAQDIYTEAILNFRENIVTNKIEFLKDTKAYLYATCRNLHLVNLKKKERVHQAVFETYDTSYAEDFDDHEQVWYRERLSKLTEEAMASLPDKCQQILKAFYFDKLNMDEIANKMSFTNSNVAKVSKSRCFQKLMDKVRELQSNTSNLE